MGTKVPRVAGRIGAAKDSYECRFVDFRWTGRSSVEMKAVLLLTLFALACTPAHTVYIPRDPQLKREPPYFYPPARTSPHPKSGICVLGNAFAFCKHHAELDERLASH